MGVLVFGLLTLRFCPNWITYYREYRQAITAAESESGRSATRTAFGDTFAAKRGVEVARQAADLSAEIKDVRHVIVRWRLLMPALGHFLGLPVWAVLGLAHVGCLFLIAGWVAMIFRASAGSVLEAACFGIVAGATAPFMTSMGWLGYYDAWLAIGLTVAAFARPPAWVWLACLLTPWIDERFVLGLPLALGVRWLHFAPEAQDSFSWFKRQAVVPLILVVGFAAVRLRLGGSGSSQTVREYFNTFIFGRRIEPARLVHGMAAGLRMGWVLVLLAVLGTRRNSDCTRNFRTGLLVAAILISILV